MIDQLKKNIHTELLILKEISKYNQIDKPKGNAEKKLILGTINSLTNSLRILNDTIPELLKEISVTQKLPANKIKDEMISKNLEIVNVKRVENDINVVISKKNKEKFLEELSISENLIKRLKKKSNKNKDNFEEFKAARGYLKYSNKFFLNSATNMINRGYFRSLYSELKKSNMLVLFETYVAMIFFSVFISFFVSVGIVIFLLFFDVSLIFPFFSIYKGDILLKFVKVSWIILVLPILTFIMIYISPSMEKKSIRGNIDRELPFAVVHMSAISGSGLSPIQIFKIIGLSNEYPHLRREIRKIMNQINLYGYDLVTALNNSSKNSPSENLSELYSGLSTTIHSGGDLKEFFEKRSESLILSYRLEREKYSKTAETFMDIYISVVIAAPMILMLLLVVISVANVGMELGQFQITLIIVSIISFINVIFLTFLHIKQPVY